MITEPKEMTQLIAKTFTEFIDSLNQNKWVGRERELINYFVFNHLIDKCESKGKLHSKGQIFIECAVPQIKEGGKKQVNKDLE